MSFTWIVFIEFNFTFAFLLIRKTSCGRFVGNIVCIPHHLSAGGGGLSLLLNFQKKGLTGSQFLEEGYWERGGDLF